MKSDKELSLYAIARSELLGPIRSHVTASDDCRPHANLFQFFRKHSLPFDRHERIGGAVILDTQGCK